MRPIITGFLIAVLLTVGLFMIDAVRADYSPTAKPSQTTTKSCNQDSGHALVRFMNRVSCWLPV